MTEEEETGTETAPTTQADKDWKAETEKWKTLARQHEANSKKLLAIEESQKTEAQKLVDARAAAEKTATDSQAEAMRLRVAVAKGLPADLIDRLHGSTKEELEADADALLKLFKTQQSTGDPARVVADLRPGALPATAAGAGTFDADAWIRSKANK